MKHISSPFILTWADLCSVWMYRRWILRMTFGCTILGVFLAFMTPMRYTAKALFREGKTQPGMASSVSSIILSSMMNGNQDESGVVAMQTDRILRSVVQELGMQVQVKRSNRIYTYLQRAYENARLLCGDGLIEQLDFVFEDVHYMGRKPLYFSFVFKDEDHFEVLDQRGSLLKAATLGEKILLDDATFSLIQKASYCAIGKVYSAEIVPWQQSVETTFKNLEIRPEKLDKSLLNLFYSHPSRTKASQILDGIMEAYLQYLQEENDRIAQKQLEFLDKRQMQFAHKFEQELSEYIACLQQNISAYGFFEVEQQIEFLAVPQQQLKSKLIELDSLLERLKKIQSSYYYAAHDNLPSFYKQPVILDISFSSPSAMPKWQKNRVEQFAGIDLETAKTLHTSYQKEVDTWQERIDTLSFLLQRIHGSDFDLNALSVLVNDPVTANLVGHASELALQLKDAGNRSPKDLIRTQESLAVQKKFIAEHLRQSLELYQQSAWKDLHKLARLRDVMMTLIEGEKALVYKKLEEIQNFLGEVPARWKVEKQMELRGQIVHKIIEGLTQVIEGKTLDHHLKQLSSKIVDKAYSSSSPKKSPFFLLIILFLALGWVSSYLFFFCRFLWKGFPLTESTARALDLMTGGSLGPFCDTFLSDLSYRDIGVLRCLADFIQNKNRENKGVVVALAGNRYPLFTRNVAHLLSMRGKKTLIIDASFDFAQPQVQTGTLWNYLTGATETWKVCAEDGLDMLLSGGTGRFCSELLHTERFTQLLDKVRCDYDVILVIYTGIYPTSARSCLLEKTDLLLLSVQEETLEQLEHMGVVERLKKPASAMVVFNA